jgi:hypothetical protein
MLDNLFPLPNPFTNCAVFARLPVFVGLPKLSLSFLKSSITCINSGEFLKVVLISSSNNSISAICFSYWGLLIKISKLFFTTSSAVKTN